MLPYIAYMDPMGNSDTTVYWKKIIHNENNRITIIMNVDQLIDGYSRYNTHKDIHQQSLVEPPGHTLLC